MFAVSITEKTGSSQVVEFDKNEVTIGRVPGNDIVLAKSNISKQHTKIVLKGEKFIIVDNNSTNGTFVNNRKVTAPQVLKPSDSILIGDYTLRIMEAEEEAYDDEPPPEEDEPAQEEAYEDDYPDDVAEDEPEPEEVRAPPARVPARGKAAPKAAGRTRAAEPEEVEEAPAAKRGPMRAREVARVDPAVEAYAKLQKDIHDRLIEYLDLRRLDMDRLGDDELWQRTEKAIQDIIDQMTADGELPEEVDVDMLLEDVLNEALGLGPLEEFLADDDISEIMVNHANQIFIERKGKIVLSEKIFSSNQAVLGVIERIVAPIGRRIDESSPLVDARLKDGSRVNAIIPPLALKGPCITIRKFKKEKLQIEDLIKFKSITPQVAEFLDMCVKAHKNIVISGGTGSGKTTLLNVMTSFIQDDERIVTVEDSAELQIYQPHWVQLESRPPNLEGKGQIHIRDLVKNCLRMRPDRIVVGECRAGETLDMLQAMNTGHDGSLTTLHANTPRDAIARMETMSLMAGMDLPLKAIREQIAAAVNMIVQQTRFGDGSRRVTYVTEIAGMEVDIVTLQDIFYYKQDGFTEEGKVKGRFVATGFVPKFYDDLQRRGVPVNMNIFRED